MVQQGVDWLSAAGLDEVDPELASLLSAKLERRRTQIDLIASESSTWLSILQAVGSVAHNKIAEGYPGSRYHGGCEVIDRIEETAIERAKDLFGADHANVQPHAGTQANLAVYFAALDAGDTILAMRLDHGGTPHARAEGELLRPLLRRRPLRRRPREGPHRLRGGRAARPQAPAEAHRLRRIGLSARDRGGPVPEDRGRGGRAPALRHGAPRRARRCRTAPEPGSALRLRHGDHEQDAERTPGRLRPLQGATRAGSRQGRLPRDPGSPHFHAIAAKATCFKIASSETFRAYQRQIRANADAIAEALVRGGLSVLTGGTDTHLLLVDLRGTSWTGRDAEDRLREAGVIVNKNTIPFEERPPTVTSGLRLGTTAVTMRGFDEDDMREVGAITCAALGDGADRDALRARSDALCSRRPLYPDFPGFFPLGAVADTSSKRRA